MTCFILAVDNGSCQVAQDADTFLEKRGYPADYRIVWIYSSIRSSES